jgi:murein DD-endopeptidase MepM/ murein hydrolase activator NlpD
VTSVRARRTWAAGVALFVLGALGAAEAGTGPAQAAGDPLKDRKSAVDGQIGQVRETLEGASKDVVAAAVAVKQTRAGLVTARAASAAAAAALAAAVAHDHDVAARLAVAEAEQAKAERAVAAGLSTQQRTREQLGRMVRETYMGSGVSGLSLALGADTPEDFASRLALAGVALRSQGNAVDELAVQQSDLRALDSKVQAVAAEVTELKQQSAAAVAARRTAQQAAVAAQARAAALVVQEQAALRVAQSKVGAERVRLAALQSEQAKLRAMLVARARAEAAARRRQGGGGAGGGGDAAPGPSSGYLSYPANGPITSGFGLRYHPILHIWRLHSGTDFGIPCGTPVYAAAPGVVISAGWAGGYGNRVVIDHGMVRGIDLATTYNHLTRIVAGGRVSRGELIAYSGTTGLSTGCHLHFEVLVNGSYVNPVNWL